MSSEHSVGRRFDEMTAYQPAPEEAESNLDSRYFPFVRDDSYGALGKGQFTILQSTWLCIAGIFLFPIRLFFVILFVLTFYFVCRVATLGLSPETFPNSTSTYSNLKGFRKGLISFFGKWTSRGTLLALGFVNIKIRKKNYKNGESCYPVPFFNNDNKNNPIDANPNSICVISNHVSWIDILFFLYYQPKGIPSFVAKSSLAKAPIVGFLCKCLGVLFVERETKNAVDSGISNLLMERIKSSAKDSSKNIMLIFPEGTTTNGKYLLPFKSGAFLAKNSVLPVILKYPYKKFSPTWETIGGFRHFFLLCCQFCNYLEATVLPVYDPSTEECSDPKLYALNIRKLYAIEGNFIMSQSDLQEKRGYNAALLGKLLIKSNSHDPSMTIKG